jgi:hypothetical protein
MKLSAGKEFKGGEKPDCYLSPVHTTLNFWYGTDKIGIRINFLVLGLPI